MATLVTGGTGFIGSNLVKVLVEKGHQVISLDIAPPDPLVRRYLGAHFDEVTWLQGDITDRQAVLDLVGGHGIEKIAHAAVYTVVLEEVERQETARIFDINLAGTVNLLELAAAVNCTRFVYVSSGGVYEASRGPGVVLKETSELVPPRSIYSVSKYASELLTSRYAHLHGFSAVSVRLGGPYGPMERPTGHRAVMSMLYQMTGMAIRGEPLQAPASAVWSFTHALDLAAGIALALDHPAPSHEVYNLASGQSCTSEELMDALREAVPGVRFEGGGFESRASSYGVTDASRIEQDLGFQPQFDIASGLKQYIDWRTEFGYSD